MRRRSIVVTMALGLVITMMGFTGIYAEFTDRATTQTNSAVSGTQPKAADLRIGTSVNEHCTDATYSEDLATGIFDVSGLQPDSNVPSFVWVCLKNVGTAPLSLTTSAIDVVETETGCTGDEALSGDATCGTAGVGDGELGDVLRAQLLRFDCATQEGPSDLTVETIEHLATTPGSLGTLASGAVACLRVGVYFPEVSGDLTAAMVEVAQSDKVEWRFAFDGTAN